VPAGAVSAVEKLAIVHRRRVAARLGTNDEGRLSAPLAILVCLRSC
jgi:hypothetical protein